MHFLNCVIQWDPTWSNKPKFHLILHILDHISRFGPAILFTTETLESYNAIIREWSIHSNRQAPSHDIAQHAAKAASMHHLLSGGYYPIETLSANGLTIKKWTTVGEGVKQLLEQSSLIQKKLGIVKSKPIIIGEYLLSIFII
jgi:hypothetical protein